MVQKRIQNLRREPGFHIHKNPIINNFFKEIGWVDELGSGVRNIYKSNKIYSGADPVFIEEDVFKTTILLVTN